MQSAFRGSIMHCPTDPGGGDPGDAVEIFEDGLLVVEDGRVAGVGDAGQMGRQYPDAVTVDHGGKLIVPGFVDCHVHASQVDIIGSYGARLLDWLDSYAFPGEARFADTAHARSASAFFLDQLLKNGTTTAAVFTTVHAGATDALFEAAEARGMRIIAGKVAMDRNAPEELLDDPQAAYEESRQLLRRWHGKGRLGYAITPRFAVTSSDAQLELLGQLAGEHPDAWVHSHLAENDDEIAAVAAQFPSARSYLDVYDRCGLVRERSVFAHCLHLDATDRRRLAETGAAAAFCPSSNLFLGSGLFDLATMNDTGVRVGLASDVGGGTSLSMLKTMAAAYQVLQLGGQSLPATRALYLATLGAASALRLDDVIGNFDRGKEADFVVLDPAATEISARRASSAASLEDLLFALIILGDDRHVAATYVCGDRAQV